MSKKGLIREALSVLTGIVAAAAAARSLSTIENADQIQKAARLPEKLIMYPGLVRRNLSREDFSAVFRILGLMVFKQHLLVVQ